LIEPNTTLASSLAQQANNGHDSVVKVLLADKRVDLNITISAGWTALHLAIHKDRFSVVKLLLTDERVDPNIRDWNGNTTLSFAALYDNLSMMELLLADHRTIRTRPPNYHSNETAIYDTALRNVKRPRNARFRGIIRAMVVFRRMRLSAAQAVYAPGGAGFAAAAASFNAVAANLMG
jgi:ankyrin repeat protein